MYSCMYVCVCLCLFLYMYMCVHARGMSLFWLDVQIFNLGEENYPSFCWRMEAVIAFRRVVSECVMRCLFGNRDLARLDGGDSIVGTGGATGDWHMQRDTVGGRFSLSVGGPRRYSSPEHCSAGVSRFCCGWGLLSEFLVLQDRCYSLFPLTHHGVSPLTSHWIEGICCHHRHQDPIQTDLCGVCMECLRSQHCGGWVSAWKPPFGFPLLWKDSAFWHCRRYASRYWRGHAPRFPTYRSLSLCAKYMLDFLRLYHPHGFHQAARRFLWWQSTCSHEG